MNLIRKICCTTLWLLLCIGLYGCASSEPELHIYTWINYIKPSIIEKFEKEHHCRVVVNTFDSNESMYAKLKLGATGYDIIVPSNYYADLMQKQGMLHPIDRERIPNAKYLDPNYTKMLDSAAAKYGIPYLVAITGIAYHKDRVNMPKPTWDIFNDKSLKGRMTMLNDPREALGAALKFLGYSINTTNDTEIRTAEKTLIAWKKNLAKFESEQYKDGVASGEYLAVQGFVGELLLVAQENPAIACVLPEEGTIFSIDLLTISKDSPNKDLAYTFINYLHQPENVAENIIFTLFLIPNTAAYELLPANIRDNPAIFPTDAVAGKSEIIKNLDRDTELYNRAWDRVKAAE